MTPCRIALWLAGPAFLTLIGGSIAGRPDIAAPAAVAGTVLLAFGVRSVEGLRPLGFTAWIIAAVTVAMLYPVALTRPAGLDMRNPWVMTIIIQCVMFGMGTQMSLSDFRGVAKMPWPVAIGFIGQFTIMPLCGWGLASSFDFPPEIAAGVILIGCCPSGLASNVMSYIARANLPLGVTITACTTIAAPVMTPLMMKLLAGKLIDVSFMKMMFETMKVMIVPLTAAFMHDLLKDASPGRRRFLHGMAAASVLVLIAYAAGGWQKIEASGTVNAVTFASIGGYLCAAVVGGVLWHHAVTRLPQLMKWMPVLSMFGIIYVTSVTTAAGRDNLLKVGPLLLLAAALHNCAGYLLGYWLARAARLDAQSCRTVSFEVGLQNGGLGASLSSQMGMLSTMGLASTIFNPWMNISGSLLANWWRRRKTE